MPPVGRGRNGDRQQHIAGVGVGHQRAFGDTLRRRPGDRPGRGAGRQVEVQLRRHAGIARVLPVGVPARRQPQPQADAERLARRDRVDVRDQRGGGARAGDRRALQGARRHDPADEQQARQRSSQRQMCIAAAGSAMCVGIMSSNSDFRCAYGADTRRITSMLPELPVTDAIPSLLAALAAGRNAGAGRRRRAPARPRWCRSRCSTRRGAATAAS